MYRLWVIEEAIDCTYNRNKKVFEVSVYFLLLGNVFLSSIAEKVTVMAVVCADSRHGTASKLCQPLVRDWNSTEPEHQW